MSAATAQATEAPPRVRGVVAGPLVAIVTLIVGLIVTDHLGIALRDPDHVALTYVLLVGLGVALLVGLDIAIRAAARSGGFPPSKAAMAQVRRERWTARRGAAAAVALVSFYVTYMAYRNLKAVVPLIRPEANFDRQLADLDRSLFAGHDPAGLLHSLLGTGIAAHLLSAFYVAFIVFLPLTIGVTLVFSRNLQAGLFYTCAQSVNWLIGAGSYYLLPSLGPIYAEPGVFAGLPHSEAARLQDVLLDQRVEFLRDPAAATPQSIAAFASLHISMSFTAAVAAHLLGAGRRLKIALWVWFGITTIGTIYLGWHYVVDDIAGVALGAIALGVAAVLTGTDLRGLRRRWGAVGRSRVSRVRDAEERPPAPAMRTS